jgi:1-phosphofructokinase/tagatose 6-phosphate kinase
MTSPILTICLNPVIQKTIFLPQLIENQVNRSREYYTDASGKGVNVTRVLTQLGQKVVHLTQLGGRFREFFLSLTDSDRLKIEWVDSFAEVRGAYTLISREKNTMTEIVEEALPVQAGTEGRVMALYQKLLPACELVIISGTKAAGFSDALFPEMVRLAKQSEKIVVIDFRGTDLINSIEFKPDFIKPNFQEFVATFFPTALVAGKIEKLIHANVREKMKALFRQFGITTILTQGAQEILFVENGEIRSRHPEKIIPVNTIGCGDAFAAGFATDWLKQRQLLPAIDSGMECARRNALLRRPGVIE